MELTIKEKDYNMIKPQYKVIAVTIDNGKRTEEIVSKTPMYKYEANKAMIYMNLHNGVYNNADNCHYYIVVDKDGQPVTIKHNK